MTGKNLEIISQIVLWFENSFRIDWGNAKQFLLLHYYYRSISFYLSTCMTKHKTPLATDGIVVKAFIYKEVELETSMKIYLISILIFNSICLSQKLLSDSQRDSITKDFNSLNLTKYVGEVVSDLCYRDCCLEN